jgi:hypothetical protein
VAHSDLFVVTAGMKYSSGDYQRRVKLYGKWLVEPVELAPPTENASW